MVSFVGPGVVEGYTSGNLSLTGPPEFGGAGARFQKGKISSLEALACPDNSHTGYALDSGRPKILWLPAGRVSQQCPGTALGSCPGGVSATNRASSDGFPGAKPSGVPNGPEKAAGDISEAGGRQSRPQPMVAT